MRGTKVRSQTHQFLIFDFPISGCQLWLDQELLGLDCYLHVCDPDAVSHWWQEGSGGHVQLRPWDDQRLKVRNCACSWLRCSASLAITTGFYIPQCSVYFLRLYCQCNDSVINPHCTADPPRVRRYSGSPINKDSYPIFQGNTHFKVTTVLAKLGGNLELIAKKK